jgi:pimeloyl-ACP methyl ester carboxylesterase
MGSPAPTGIATAQASVGADIIVLIQHLGGPAVVIGHSFSAGSAVVAAAQAPTDVLGIVLIAPFASPPKLNPLLALLAKPVMRSPTLRAMYYRSLYPGTKPADFGGYLAALKANLRQPGRMAAAATMANPSDDSARASRSRARCPALIVTGSKDRDFPNPGGEAEAMAAVLAGPAEIALLQGAGHYPHVQLPAETGRPLLGFLEQTVHA